MKVVTNLNTLKAMQNYGVVFCNDTGSQICGLYSNKKFKCYYVDSAPHKFEYKGKMYGERYVDGCFNPYVVEL